MAYRFIASAFTAMVDARASPLLRVTAFLHSLYN